MKIWLKTWNFQGFKFWCLLGVKTWLTKNWQVSFRACHENFLRAPLPHLYQENPNCPDFNITVCMKQNTSARLGTAWLPLNNSSVLNLWGTSILQCRGGGRLGPKNASEICVRAANFASINVGDKYPKLCTLNFRYDPKIGILSQLLRFVVTKLPKSFLLFRELGTVQNLLNRECKRGSPRAGLSRHPSYINHEIFKWRWNETFFMCALFSQVI